MKAENALHGTSNSRTIHSKFQVSFAIYLYSVAGALLVVQLCVAGASDDDAALVVVDELFHAERIVAPGSRPVKGEGAARAALDGAVGGALARRVAPDEKVPHRVGGVEVETAACECETLTA